jgi:two-component system, LuxR family, response regulator FixJ
MVTKSIEGSSRQDPAEPKIYLVDRDEGVRDSLKVLLESHDLQAFAFASPAEFLAKAAPTPEDCLVLSSNRLIRDGLELLSTLRRRGIATPVIFVVGGGSLAVKATALASGAAAYLERPVEEKALMRAISATRERR